MMLIEMICLDFLLKDFLYFYLYCVKKNIKKICFGILIVLKIIFEKMWLKFDFFKVYC